MFSNAPRPSSQERMAFGSIALPDCMLCESPWDTASDYVSGLSPTFLPWVRGEAFSLAGSMLWHFS